MPPTPADDAQASTTVEVAGEAMLQAARRAIAGEPWVLLPETLRTIATALDAGDLATLGEVAGTEPQTARFTGAGGGSSVAVIPVQGVLRTRMSFLEMLFGGGGGGVPRIRRELRSAVGDDQVGAIVLNVDSPGGSVDGIPELAAEIREARQRKPVVAVANAHAASGAYWLAAQASELYVTPSGDVGSIGVFVAHEDWSRFDDRLGVKTTFVSAGRYKVEANPLEPLSDEAREHLQAVVDEFYSMFVADVAAGRDVKESAVRSGFGEGRMVLAADAVAEGMADKVGTVDDAIARAFELAGRSGRSGTRAEDDDATTQAEFFLAAGGIALAGDDESGDADGITDADVDTFGDAETGTPASSEATPSFEEWEAELAASSPSFRAATAAEHPSQ